MKGSSLVLKKDFVIFIVKFFWLNYESNNSVIFPSDDDCNARILSFFYSIDNILITLLPNGVSQTNHGICITNISYCFHVKLKLKTLVKK